MIILGILNFLAAAFIGYVIGRWGHYYLNFWIGKDNLLPHHWIYGFILIIVGYYYLENNLQVWTVAFGAGLLISDLRDFLHLKFFAPDGKDKKDTGFWGID